jgi:hypothetical protein
MRLSRRRLRVRHLALPVIPRWRAPFAPGGSVHRREGCRSQERISRTTGRQMSDVVALRRLATYLRECIDVIAHAEDILTGPYCVGGQHCYCSILLHHDHATNVTSPAGIYSEYSESCETLRVEGGIGMICHLRSRLTHARALHAEDEPECLASFGLDLSRLPRAQAAKRHKLIVYARAPPSCSPVTPLSPVRNYFCEADPRWRQHSQSLAKV